MAGVSTLDPTAGLSRAKAPARKREGRASDAAR